MPRLAEITHMRLQIMDPIEAVVTDVKSGRTTTHVGYVYGVHRTSGSVSRGEGQIIIDPKERKLGYIPYKKRPKRGHPLNPLLYTVLLPMPSARTYTNQFIQQIIYVPTGEMTLPGGQSTITIRRTTEEAAKHT